MMSSIKSTLRVLYQLYVYKIGVESYLLSLKADMAYCVYICWWFILPLNLKLFYDGI